MHACVCMCVVVGMYKGVLVGDPRRPGMSEPSEELKAVVTYLVWIPGIEPGSSRRAARALNH